MASTLAVDVLPANATIATAVPVGSMPHGVAVDPVTNKIYVANRDDNNVTLIDGATNAPLGAAITVGSYPNVVQTKLDK